MSGTKKHIDKLFADIFKDFSLLVSNKDMEAIDDKTSAFREQEQSIGSENLFSGFEISVDETDWLAIKAKLENEKSSMSQEHMLSAGFKDFELPVRPEDWTRTYEKLKAAKKRRIAYWWLSAGVVILALGGFWLANSASSDQDLLTATEQIQVSESDAKHENNKGEKFSTQTLDGKDAVQSVEAGSDKLHPEQTILPKRYSTNPQPGNYSPSVKPSAGNHLPGKGKAGKNMVLQSGGFDDKTISGHTDASPQKDVVTAPVNEQYTEALDPQKVNVGESSLPANGNKEDDKNIHKTITSDSTTKQQEPTDSSKKKDKQEELPAPPKMKNRIYIGLLSQLASTFRHLDRQNNERYNSIRNAAEKPFAQWTYGLEVGLLKKHSQFSIGIQSTSQSWTSSYNYSYKIYDSLPYKDPNGHVIGYFLVRPRDTSINEEQVVKINKIQVPFQFSQTLKLNSKINLLATLGGTIGLITKTEGSKILNPVNNYLYPYSRFSDQERKMSFMPSLGLGLQYELNKHFMLQGSAYGNYSVTGRFKNSFNANDHPYSVGISLKLMYMIK